MTDVDTNKWDYLWTVSCCNRTVGVYIESGLGGMDDPRYLVALRQSQELYKTFELDNLQSAREIAEKYVTHDFVGLVEGDDDEDE